MLSGKYLVTSTTTTATKTTTTIIIRHVIYFRADTAVTLAL
jgi:hypothetical protein